MSLHPLHNMEHLLSVEYSVCSAMSMAQYDCFALFLFCKDFLNKMQVTFSELASLYDNDNSHQLDSNGNISRFNYDKVKFSKPKSLSAM